MTDQELADKVVALGVGTFLPGWYRAADNGEPMKPLPMYLVYGEKRTLEQFVRDWRVAGALMENADEPWTGEIYGQMDGSWYVVVDSQQYHNESLPRAIIEACVEALTND